MSRGPKMTKSTVYKGVFFNHKTRQYEGRVIYEGKLTRAYADDEYHAALKRDELIIKLNLNSKLQILKRKKHE